MNVRQDFDYIIVRAGSAGYVLPACAREDPSVRAGLVAAGGPDDATQMASSPSLRSPTGNVHGDGSRNDHADRRAEKTKRSPVLIVNEPCSLCPHHEGVRQADSDAEAYSVRIRPTDVTVGLILDSGDAAPCAPAYSRLPEFR